MNTAKSTAMAVLLIGALAILGGVSVLKGGLFIAKHEGDTLHLMQIVFRMAEGQIPHKDFMTPIGALAFWPIAVLVKAGLGVGMAIIWSQVMFAALFVPILLRVTTSRLSPWVGAGFGLAVMVLLLALVHGEAESSVSISMHYNRLAWAAAFVAIITALIPPQKARNPWMDGVIIGLMVSAMAMIKMTYFVSFALPILLALVLTGQRRALLWAAVTGGAVVAAITVAWGGGFWVAYAGDLMTVAQSDVRAAPGKPFSAVMGAPAYLGGSMVAIASVIFLRQAGVATGGLILLLLLPGFFYVTYQNFGNDPQWLWLLVVLVLSLRHAVGDARNGYGWSLRDALGICAAMGVALSAPSFLNLAYSPFRHVAVDVAKYAPILPDGGPHQDLRSLEPRIFRVDAQVALDGVLPELARYQERDDPVVFMGEEMRPCTLQVGLPRVMATIARDIEEAGLAEGKALFAIDIFSSHWLFGSMRPLDGGAPWYYGGTPGLEDADYVLAPLCPITESGQRQIANIVSDEIEAGRLSLREIRRTELYILFEILR